MTADIHTLAGPYALDALPSDERRLFEHHLAACEACRHEVRELEGTAMRLAAAAYEEPPPTLRGRVLAEIDVTRQDLPLVPRAGGLPGRQWFQKLMMPVAAVLALFVLGLGILVGQLNQRLQRLEVVSGQVVEVLSAADARTVALTAPQGITARFAFSPSGDRGIFVADALPDVGEDQTYQLWLIGQGGPVPAGLFRPGPDGRASQLVMGDLAEADALGVTIEPAGGSARPTSQVLIKGELDA
ncbi:MAG: anti-sigma factor [Actinomycetota bacterium]|nr:anti-sigma factor [Actinomycetota bacterium]